jgi:hypothetical protein
MNFPSDNISINWLVTVWLVRMQFVVRTGLHRLVHTGSSAHLAPYSVGIMWAVVPEWSNRSLKLIAHLHLLHGTTVVNSTHLHVMRYGGSTTAIKPCAVAASKTLGRVSLATAAHLRSSAAFWTGSVAAWLQGLIDYSSRTGSCRKISHGLRAVILNCTKHYLKNLHVLRRHVTLYLTLMFTPPSEVRVHHTIADFSKLKIRL